MAHEPVGDVAGEVGERSRWRGERLISDAIGEFAPGHVEGLFLAVVDVHGGSQARHMAYTAMSMPPCTPPSAWSSPETLTPRTGTRPATGDFQIALVTSPPRQATVRALQTFTATIRPTSTGRLLPHGSYAAPSRGDPPPLGGPTSPACPQFPVGAADHATPGAAPGSVSRRVLPAKDEGRVPGDGRRLGVGQALCLARLCGHAHRRRPQHRREGTAP